MRKIIVGGLSMLCASLFGVAIFKDKFQNISNPTGTGSFFKDSESMPYLANDQKSTVSFQHSLKNSIPLKVITPSDTSVKYHPNGNNNQPPQEGARSEPLSTVFENMSADQVSEFLLENALSNPKSSLGRSPSFATAPGTPEKFTGIFRGRLERLPEVDNDLIPDEGLTLVLALQGKTSGMTYQGKQDLYVFEGNRQVGHLAGKGNLRDIKTVPGQPPNILFIDSPRESNYFQLFVAESSDRIIGNYYVTNTNTSNIEKIGKIELIREHH